MHRAEQKQISFQRRIQQKAKCNSNAISASREIGRQTVYDIHHRAAPLGGAILHHLLKPWHFLNFFPLPHGQGSFGFTFT